MGLFDSIGQRVRLPEPERPVSVLSQGIELTGSLRVDGTLRIDGVVRGAVSGSGEIILGRTGDVHGDVNAERVVVAGRLRGDVVASTAVTLSASAVVEGDVRTSRLTVEDGAVVNGRFTMAAPAIVLEPVAQRAPALGPFGGLAVAVGA